MIVGVSLTASESLRYRGPGQVTFAHLLRCCPETTLTTGPTKGCERRKSCDMLEAKPDSRVPAQGLQTF